MSPALKLSRVELMRDGPELRRPNTVCLPGNCSWEGSIVIVRRCFILVISIKARPINANSVAQRSERAEIVLALTCNAHYKRNVSRRSIP